MRGLALTLAILGITPFDVAAQDAPTEATETTPSDETADTTPEVEGEVEREADAGTEIPPPPETSTPPARTTPSRASSLPSPRARVAALDDEIPGPPDPIDPPLSADAEVFIAYGPTAGIGLSGLSGLGGLGALDGSLLALRTDFVFAADVRNFLGVGLAVSHTESDEFFGSPGSRADRVEVPLVAQLYFEDPRRGAAVPTLRIVPAFRWEGGQSSSAAWRAGVGGRLDLAVGVTWFILPWLALRFLGDVGVSALVYYEGLGGNVVSAFVGANVGIVVRM